MNRFSKSIENKVLLKREDQQPVKSFKLRGAYNCIAQLTEEQKRKGVIAASAGNHAQGVAYAAQAMQIKATIVMPETTPDIKVDAVRNFGSKYVDVVLHGTSFDQASEHAIALCDEQSSTMIPPFDHEDVIAGQGTIAKEILEQAADIDYLFVAVGGGGLAAGIGVYVKQINPKVKIIGVESEESACLKAAMQAGKPVTLSSVGIFADGVAVRTIGKETFRLCQAYIDEVVTVTNDEICAAIKDIFDDTRVIAEPAGALSIAAMRKYAIENNLNNQVFAGILCGANINFHTLRYVSERCELGEQKEAVFAVKIPEEKGSFKNFCSRLSNTLITEFNYRYSSTEEAHVFVGIKLKQGLDEYRKLLSELGEKGYECYDLTDNELAKLHVRHMVGGRPPIPLNEKLFSFAFPEYPGALLHFLNTLGETWNITLFHYRNHGAAEGLALTGFEVEDSQYSLFLEHLAQLDFASQEQTDNPAYDYFLSKKR